MKIVNLTQHLPTEEQVAAGVFQPEECKEIQRLLTFDSLADTSWMNMSARAYELACIAKKYGATAAMIGGAPFFMSTLETALKANGITPVYAFSVRQSVESFQPDGSITKASVFKHVGFVGGD